MTWFRLRYSIGHEGWSYLLMIVFVLVGAVFRDVNLLILLVGMMAGPFLMNWRLATLVVRRMHVRRQVAERVCAGDLLNVELAAACPRMPFQLWAVAVADRVAPVDETRDDEPARVTTLMTNVPRDGVGHASYRCLLTRRGRYRFGPLTVSTRFPFGLVRASRRIDTPGELLVCPRLGRLTATFSEAVESERAGSRQAQPRRGFVDGDYYALRDWRSGDSQRWIHWRTTAKRDELTVREFEEQRHRDVAMLVDLWQPERPSESVRGRVELALSFAATVVSDVCRRGARQFALALCGDESHVASGPTSMLMAQEFLDRMAVVRGSDEPDWETALGQLLAQLRRDSRIIVVTTSTKRMERLRTQAVQSAGDRRVQALIRDALWLDVSSPEFARYFLVD
ncbi:MAG: DUF58 domain-containing protein [Pirellulaceae bacterium]